MPCKYEIMNEGKLVIEHWTGTVGIEEIMSHKRRLLQDPSVSPRASVLTDCRGALFAVPGHRVMEISEADRRSDNKTRIGRYAFLVNDDVYQRAQDFARQVQQFGVSVVVFNSFETACKWVGIETRAALKTLKRLAG